MPEMGWISLDDIDQDNIKYVPVVTDPVVGIPLSEPPTENVVNAKAGGEDSEWHLTFL